MINYTALPPYANGVQIHSVSIGPLQIRWRRRVKGWNWTKRNNDSDLTNDET